MFEYHTALNWLSIHWTDVLAVFGGAAGLSVFLESLLLKLKNKFHVDSHKFAYLLSHLAAALTALTSWYLSSSLTGKATLGVYAGLAIVAEGWQRFAVSSFFKKVVIPFLSWKSGNTATPETMLAAPAAPEFD